VDGFEGLVGLVSDLLDGYLGDCWSECGVASVLPEGGEAILTFA
jgi:hypothetical protein